MDFYAAPGRFTDLSQVDPGALSGVPKEAVEICGLAAGLVIQPHDTSGLPAERLAENQIRDAAAILRALLALDPAGVEVARPPARRVVGTCRHFAVVTTALLRLRGIPARARCGFATYFQPGKGLDHWITEYRQDGAWVRFDSEVGREVTAGEFRSGGEAWAAHRAGEIDATGYGVWGTENWGPAEIRGNAIRDLGALGKVETLPWDEWGRMTESYRGETGDDYDRLIDLVAKVCATGEPQAVETLLRNSELEVPADLR